jgi:NADPH:quinone reductase-like Zn-dependent oxidoreductase
MSQLKYPTPFHLWYKAQAEVGYGFGPGFQKLLSTEVVTGKRKCRSLLSLLEPKSAHSPQSLYPMHPACIDCCFQTVTPSLWAGERYALNAVLVPASIDDLMIYPKISGAETGLSLANSEYTGRGRVEEAQSFFSNCEVFEPQSGECLLKMSGLRYHKLDTGTNVHSRHTYSRTVWQPDITFLSQDQLYSLANRADCGDIHRLIDLIAHKNPKIKVLEISSIPDDATSLWLSSQSHPTRYGYTQYSYISSDAKALVSTQEKYRNVKRASFNLLDITMPNAPMPETGYDLVIVKVAHMSKELLSRVADNVSLALSDTAIAIFLEQETGPSTLNTPRSSTSSHVMVEKPEEISELFEVCPTESADVMAVSCLESCGYTDILRVPESWATKAYIAKTNTQTNNSTTAKSVCVAHLSSRGRLSKSLRSNLEQSGWQVTEQHLLSSELQSKGIVLILDETVAPLLASISETQWNILQKLILNGNRVLWVTEGSQMNVVKPDNALAHGLFRTIRAEDRSANLVTLDVEYSESPSTYLTIERVLRLLLSAPPKSQIESEYVERGSIIHVNRILQDELINTAKDAENFSGVPVPRVLADIVGVTRLQAERLANLDSLCYSELSHQELPMLDGHIEVDIKAAGLNFKDVAVAMGIVPENEHLLGLEGSGIVRRVGNKAGTFHVGDRVAILKNGTFANRIQCPIERAHHIPSDMSFKDAATIPLVYLTSMYSLFDIGGLEKGKSVLIHSAAGGVGLSSIQLAQWIGADIFVTVGTNEKRKYLHETFNIPYERMFSSRTTEFAGQIMKLTKGKGVDVIINSLTGELLDESWRICADGGNMVEIGKKDIVDRNFLSMEPFDRNCSFRAVDFSYSKQIKDTLIAE